VEGGLPDAHYRGARQGARRVEARVVEARYDVPATPRASPFAISTSKPGTASASS
jgi:hypothetical protein